MRITLAVAVACLTLGGLAAAGDATASIRKETHIPAEGLGPALTKLAKEFDFQVLYRTEIVSDLKSPGAMGALTSDEALGKLLTGTGLTYKYLDDKTVTIIPVSTADSGQSTPANASGSPDDANTSKEVGKKTSQDFRVAQVDQTSAWPQVASNNQNQTNNQNGGPALTEIIVTAQKKSERLQDVPVPVSVLSADTLSQNNQPLLRDYFSSVPGFVVSPGAGSGNQQMLAIRGVSTGPFLNPTVGVTVDDVPYNAFTRELTPDIDPSDLAQVEVLRGPQGALYGASSMGGLLKFITVDPSTDRVFGDVQVGTNGVSNGGEKGYAFHGAVNVPVTDTFAIRASAFTRQDPGYIDNPVLGTNGVNEDHVSGGHVSTLWQVSDAFSLKLSALYQYTKSDGLNDVTLPPGAGALEQTYIAGVGPSTQQIQAYSAILKGKVGTADLTSVTGYNIYKAFTTLDYTYAEGALAQRIFGVYGVNAENNYDTHKFTQEIRADIPISQTFDWLIGTFFTHENIPFDEDFLAQNPQTGTVLGSLGSVSIPITYSEYAAFTDLTVHFTDRFDIQFGGRESHLEEKFDTITEQGPLYGGGPIYKPDIDVSPNVFTYLVTPSFKISPDIMVYARMASGYRPGRANQYNPDPLIPKTANPDKTQNYEIGAKGSALHNVLSFDASLYYIDFTNIQTNLIDPRNKVSFFTNGNGAKSEGAELSVTAHPLTGLTFGAWGSYDDAVLTAAFPAGSAAYGPAGSRLPFGARWSGNLSADQEFYVTGNVSGLLGAMLSYVGDRIGPFTTTPLRAYYPGYAKIDLHTGVQLDSWKVNLYANNVGDKRGVLGGGAGNIPPTAFFYIQPRTIGVSLSKTFK